MASSRKYAELLDIDPEAPDIFETPDLTDDTSTILTSTSPPPESSTDDIDRHGINPDEARTRFLSPNEREPTSATRIASKRKGYRSSSKRQNKDGVDGERLSSDDEGEEEEESLERKLARLRREVEEVKGEVEQRKADSDGTQGPSEEETQDIEALSEILNTVSPASSFGGEHGAASRLTKRLAAAASAAPSSQPPQPTQTTESPTTYKLTYAPTYNPTHTLSKVTAFETRLSALESALGIDTLPLPTQDRPASKSLLPSLDILDRQLATLTTSTDSSLDAMSRRIRQLTSDTQTLESARKSAKASSATQHPSSSSAPSANQTPESAPDPASLTPPVTDPDSLAKIHALYGTLPTIESLAPLLPLTLDRLRSLRALHADAGTASQTLRVVEQRQESVGKEIGEWRAGLERVEGAVKEGGEGMRENAEVVEGWVRELEGRVRVLGEGGKGA